MRKGREIARSISGLISSFDERPLKYPYLIGVAAMVAGTALLLETLAIIERPHWLWGLPLVASAPLLLELTLQRFPSHTMPILGGIFLVAALTVAGVAYVHPLIEPLSTLDFALIDAEVIPGGERLVVFPEDIHHVRSHVGFYTSCGQALITAHASRWLQVGEEYRARVDGGEVAQVRVRILGSYDVGQMIQGLPLPADRETIPLAAPGDVREGDAEVVLFGESTPVIIRGAYPHARVIVAVFHDERPVERGYSGAPLIQDGRLVGLLCGMAQFRRNLAFFRPAAEIYDYLTSRDIIETE